MKPFLTIKEIKEKLEKKDICKKDVINFYSNRLKKFDKELEATLEIFETETIKIPESGLLAGIPGVVKDNICQKNKIATCGSKILQNYVSPYDSTVVSKLKQEGAIILARANMDEFAMGSSGEFSAYKITKNPWNKKYVPGGSCSGPAAAVAAGLVPWAIGSETGGSVREPAAFCGLVGLYPTYGTNSRYGLIALTSSTDQIGPLTKTVYDNALILSISAGPDPKDSSSLFRPKIDFTKNLTYFRESTAIPGKLQCGSFNIFINEKRFGVEM